MTWLVMAWIFVALLAIVNLVIFIVNLFLF